MLNNQIRKVNDAFKTLNDVSTVTYPANKTLVIPELKTDVSMHDTVHFVNALCLALLHLMNDDSISYSNIVEVLQFKNSSLRDVSKTLFDGKFKAGQTKKGFGPFFATSLLEVLNSKHQVPEIRILRDIFFVTSLLPFISINGLKTIRLVYNKEECIVSEKNLMRICQGASILNKFRITVELMLQTKQTEGFFHPEEWCLFFREFRNRFINSVDAINSFSDSVELASVLCMANYLGIKNKFMLANANLLESAEAQMILSVDQFSSAGLAKMNSIGTLVGQSMTSEIVSYCLKATLEPIVASNFLKLVETDLYNCEIHSYKDYSLNSSIRGAVLLKTTHLENPLMAARQMDSFSNMYSYSTEFLEHIGKTYTQTLNELLSVSNVADFDAASTRADFAIKGYYTNLTDQELRMLILKHNKFAVEIALPFETTTMFDLETILSYEDKIKIVYRKDVNKNILEYDDIVGFKLVDELILTNPFVVALHSIHGTTDKYKKIVSKRSKSFFPKLNYSNLYLTPLDNSSEFTESEAKTISVTQDANSVTFDVDYRALCGIANKGKYILSRANIREDLLSKIPLQSNLLNIFRESFSQIYKNSEQVAELQNDTQFKKISDIMENSLFFKRLGSKVYGHIIQEVINYDGLISKTNISAVQLNSLTNLALVQLINSMLEHILGTSEIRLSTEIENSKQLKYVLMTGGSYENV